MSSGQLAHCVHKAFQFIENFMHATNFLQEKSTRKLGEKKNPSSSEKCCDEWSSTHVQYTHRTVLINQ